jgi:glycosyltransferase involved in cell wall biosynthesis
MIRICHLTTVHKRYDTRIFQKQCQSLAKFGYDVTLLCADNLENEQRNGVKIESVSLRSSNIIYRILIAPGLIFRLAVNKNADIYQIHDPELLRIALKIKKTGKKVIYDSHEDFPRQILEKEWVPRLFRKILSFIAESYLKRVIKKLDAVLTVTPHIVDIIKKSTPNVYLVTNFPILEDENIDFSAENYMARADNICYSGTVYNYSQQENILEAISTIDNVIYTIVGSLNQKLFAELAKYNAWSKVHYIKKVPKKELTNIYLTASIGIVIFKYSPNMGDKLGTLGNNKIFEYMLYGLPIICTDFKIWKDIIDKYKCGIYVNPNDIIELNSAINYLITNKYEAYEMGQNGKRAVIEKYNWNSQEKTYLDVIKKLSIS